MLGAGFERKFLLIMGISSPYFIPLFPYQCKVRRRTVILNGDPLLFLVRFEKPNKQCMIQPPMHAAHTLHYILIFNFCKIN
jgi:hypothetical protein